MEKKGAPGSAREGEGSRKVKAGAGAGEGAKGAPNDSIANPDISVLAQYSPTEAAQSHPQWVKTRFPSYVEPHGKHEATSVRELTHKGHTVKIITTYRVEVDGRPADLHLSVDEDGQVFTHATPFVTYASAVDLMKAVMDAYPEDAFAHPSGTTPSSAPDNPDHNHVHGEGT
jgi:hypothetical protein